MQCKLDLEISHSQFGLRSRAVDDDELEWGEGNLQQGLMWQPGLVLLDPLSDETFGADVVGAQRTVQVPFEIIDTAELFAFSPCEELPVKLDVEVGDYTLIYEVCLGTEVYYVLTLLKGKIDTATALKTDGWGLVKDQALTAGVF